MENNNKELIKYFWFKNSETEKEICNILREFEGVKKGGEEQYLINTHLQRKALLLGKFVILLKKLWVQHNHLAFSDFNGLITNALGMINDELKGMKIKRKNGKD